MVGCAAVLQQDSLIHGLHDFRRRPFSLEFTLPLRHNDAGETVAQYIYGSAAHVEEGIDAEQKK